MIVNYSFSSRYYVIFDIIELPLIDFESVLIDSVETITRSKDGSKAYVKWEGPIPECVQKLTTKKGPYTHDQMLDILRGPDWVYDVTIP